MLKFSKFGIEDYKKVSAYRERSDVKTCELTAGALFMWGDYYRPAFTVHDGTLIVKCSLKRGYGDFFLPIGENEEGAVREIEKYCAEKRLKLRFIGVEEAYLPILSARYNGLIRAEYDRKWSDYVYDAEAFRAFRGKKYAGQRNHVHKFTSLYGGAQVKTFTAADVPRALELLATYAGEKPMTKAALRENEKAALGTRQFEALGFTGIYVEYEGKMISYTLGEKCGKTQVVHIEKADRRYPGLYPFTANAYAKATDSDVVFLNREDDSGDPGLRVSKLQYQPVEILHKNLVEVLEPQKELKELPVFSVGELTVGPLGEEDADAYFRLNTDDENNAFWGYDYRKDVPDPSPEAFLRMVANDFKNGTSFSFAIRKGEKLIGEAVFYDFGFGGTCEVGLRLFREYQGKGYGKAVYAAACDRLLGELGMKKLRARCYKENARSEKMILSAGFCRTGEDDRMYYFEKK